MDHAEKRNYPQVLKVEEILECVNKFGFKIDKSTIESEDSDTIVELYTSLLEKIGVLKKEKLKIKFEGLNMFHSTGMHDRPIYIMKLFYSMRDFIKETINFDAFETADLFDPNPKRTKKILSGIISYYKYKQAEKETYKHLKENLDNAVYNYKEALIKKDKTETLYEKLR